VQLPDSNQTDIINKSSPQGSIQRTKMNPVLALIVASAGTLQNGLLGLMTTIPQISAVLVAEDISSALRMIADHRPRLVLLDMDLPEDSAQTILVQINAQSLDIGSVALVDSVQQGQKAELLGADGVLLKGFSAAKLISVTEELLGQQGRDEQIV
jgi:CheY-like chemotaxis protein